VSSPGIPDRPLVILFDIDGTLINSGGAGAVSWREAFLELYGIPANIGQYTDAGMTDPEVGRLTFRSVVGHDPSPAELMKVLASRQRHLPKAVADSTGYRVLPGVPEQLHDAGYPLGLTTGGTEAAAHVKLARANLNHYFAFGGYGSDSPDRTELTRRGIERAAVVLGRAVDPSDAVVVGDTPLDVQAAHGAGAAAVGVATGHYSVDELRAAGAEHVLATLEEPLPIA
jgi:phosphoglycolate phosphatase